jgi:GST-like protein
MASYPWIVPHAQQGQDLEDFPDLKRWFEAMRARPAVARAYEKGESLRRPVAGFTEDERKILFGQTSAHRGMRA